MERGTTESQKVVPNTVQSASQLRDSAIWDHPAFSGAAGVETGSEQSN